MSQQPETYSFSHNDGAAHGYGASYGEGAESYGHDIVTIKAGNVYPELGSWAQNLESAESVVVISGRGGVAIRGVAYLALDSSAPIEAVSRSVRIAPGQYFRWDATAEEDMVVSMVTKPAFNDEQYRVLTEQEIVGLELQEGDDE